MEKHCEKCKDYERDHGCLYCGCHSETQENRGMELYNFFLEKLDEAFGTKLYNKTLTPRTNTLEHFAILEKEEKRVELIAAMSRELSSNL